MAIDFTFASDLPGNEHFDVVAFRGSEGLSQLFQFEIELKTPNNHRADLDEMLDYTAKFTLDAGGPNERAIHGMLASFEETKTSATEIFYTAVLVPRIWSSSIYRTNEIYTTEGTVDEIVRTVLTSAGYTEGTDFELSDLAGPFISRDYVCQFRESDLDFISRLMENEGIFYYFDHTSGHDKLIITDQATYPALPTSPNLVYDESSSGTPRVFSWTCRKQRLPLDVSVRDFNPSQPSMDVAGRYEVDASGIGTEYLYGEHFSDTTEATKLATVRAEMLASGKTRYYSQTTVLHLAPGYTFTLTNHLNTDFHTPTYLITELNHEGSGLDDAGAGNATYENSVLAINAALQFRPALRTPKPRFHGTMTAFVYAEASGGMAEVDTEGRYRVHLPFDRADGGMVSSDPDRKASAWIRMAQPYVGETEGMYFPLRGGTEVLLTFINGDPDRPIISGAVPNASTPALLTNERPSESIIRTAGNNKIRMEDEPGRERIIMETPSANSWVRIGAPNDPPLPALDIDLLDEDGDRIKDGIRIRTGGDYWIESHQKYAEYYFGRPTNTDGGGNAPAGIATMLGWFGATAGDNQYNPLGLRDFASNTGSYSVTTQIGSAHVRVLNADTFNTQTGNIYDFGGYWNYNLGNSYTENYMTQNNSVTLNTKHDKDRAASGGPKPVSIASFITGNDNIGALDANTWIEKTFNGAAYEFTTGKRTLAVDHETKEESLAYTKRSHEVNVGCYAYEYTFGGESYEYKFAPVNPNATSNGIGSSLDTRTLLPFPDTRQGDFRMIYYGFSGGGNSVEHTFCRHTGAQMAYSARAQATPGGIDSFSFDWANNASASFTFAASAKFSVEASASVSLSGNLTATTNIDFSAGISLDVKVPWTCLAISTERGGDTKIELPGLNLHIKGPVPELVVEPPNKTKVQVFADKTELLSKAASIEFCTGVNIKNRLLQMFM